MKRIDSFEGEYEFLSNFYPIKVEYEGVEYNTSEHAYQSYKTLDEHKRLYIASAHSAYEAKKRGNNVEIRKDWDDIKIEIMRGILKEKFKHPDMKQKLIDTGDAELIEGNWWGDTFWGTCNGKGQNWLGKLLMEIRKELL